MINENKGGMVLPKARQPRVLDLFSGCGGMSWGLHKAGFEIIGGIDTWAQALRTFEFNHPNAKIIERDISGLKTSEVMQLLNLDVEDLEVLVGGPPCQGFSKNQTASNRFIEDPRNQLYKDFMRFVKDLKPKVVIMENVAEIYNAFDGYVRKEVIETFNKLGYSVNVKVLTAADYGVPQKRRRCIFLAVRGNLVPEFPTPTHSVSEDQDALFPVNTYVSAWEAIKGLPKPSDEPDALVKYTDKPSSTFEEWVRNPTKTVANHYIHPLQPTQTKRYLALKPGQDIRHLPKNLRPKSGYSGAYGRLDFTSVAPTITRWVFHPGSGRYGHPKEPRIITMREAARLQSFTDDFFFTGSKNEIAGQIGNSVPPLLMFSLAPTIKRLLNNLNS